MVLDSRKDAVGMSWDGRCSAALQGACTACQPCEQLATILDSTRSRIGSAIWLSSLKCLNKLIDSWLSFLDPDHSVLLCKRYGVYGGNGRCTFGKGWDHQFTEAVLLLERVHRSSLSTTCSVSIFASGKRIHISIKVTTTEDGKRL